MATSGSIDFSVNRNDIIRVALQGVGVTVEGEASDTVEVQDAAIKLNLLVKAWMAEGMPLWAVKQATLFLGKDQNTYILSTTGDHCTNSYQKFTGSLSGTTLTPDTDVTMAIGDYVGVVIDGLSDIQWTTISSVGSGNYTTASDISDNTSTGNNFFSYTKKIGGRPLKITDIWRHDIDNRDVTIRVIARTDYAEQVLKTADAFVVQAQFEPFTAYSTLKIWPEQQDVTTTLQFYYQSVIEDFDSATDTPDFPQEWFLPICYGLMELLAPDYGLPLDERQWITMQRKEFKQIAMDTSTEYASMFISPDYAGSNPYSTGSY